ncbi:transcriptional regulator NrdR [Kiritimatiella glycovorans]|uniref:Transcriptional repressor NrdR n=1 Tax=Kiritimatiella glycovorans TaxID=1307763 RepID=A0A0G3EAT0_9BACT|nr:transcriptional regulator NrdR [Kiritimatiella glycovorans]AKJ63591.1 Transcriptional repressor NrdR [Kiritimatiella glycovorans]
MRCPRCSEKDDKVIDSREAREGAAIRRRRECLSCGHRFTTYEEVLKAKLQVVKRDGRREALDRDKMFQSIKVACQKRHISVPRINGIVDAILNEIEAEYENEVPSTAVGEKVMMRLGRLDAVAYVRFASVYRRFRDVNQFMSEVERMLE